MRSTLRRAVAAVALVSVLVSVSTVGAVSSASAVTRLSATPDTALLTSPHSPTSNPTGVFTFSSVAGATFECRVDLGLWAACSGAPTLVGSDEVGSHNTGVLAEGFHTFEVRATDSTPATDPTPATAVWYVDLTAPTATITAKPSDPSNATTPSFSFTGEPGAMFRCSVDAGPPTICSSPYTTPPLADGVHLFSVSALDTAGNLQTSPTSYSWTIDTIAPDTFIQRLGSTPSSDVVNFTLTSLETVTYECNLDSSGWVPCPDSYTTPSLSDSTHTLRVRATDAAGNVDPTPAFEQWLIDTTPPDTTLTVTPSATSNQSAARFEFTSTESPATFECDIDSLGYAPCSSPFVSSPLADGTHTFSVRSTDGANHTDPTPATYTWTVAAGLPETGVDTKGPIVLALLLLGAGAVITSSTRRRRSLR